MNGIGCLHLDDADAGVAFGHADGCCVLTARQWLPATPEAVYAFMSDCRHMNLVLPAWMRLNVLDACPPLLAAGVTYDYRFRLHGLPLRWRTRITSAEPPYRFVDVQERGPYARFEHEHCFTPRDGGTLVRDTIRYQPPGVAWLSHLIDRAWVRRDLRVLFEHRHRRLEKLYANGEDPMRLLGAPLR